MRKHKRFLCNPGNSVRILYAPVYTAEDKSVDLVETGSINTHDSIQMMAEYTDLEQLLKRFNSGDVSALNQKMSFYGDCTIFHGATLRDIIENQRTVEKFYNGISDDVKAANDIHNLQDFLNKSLSGVFEKVIEDPVDLVDPVDPSAMVDGD